MPRSEHHGRRNGERMPNLFWFYSGWRSEWKAKRGALSSPWLPQARSVTTSSFRTVSVGMALMAAPMPLGTPQPAATRQEQAVIAPVQRIMDGVSLRNNAMVREQLLPGGMATLIRDADHCSFTSTPFVERLTMVRILDASCGTGEGAIRLTEHFPRAQVLGVDTFERSLALARSRFGHLAPRLMFEERSVFDLKLPAPSVDLTVCPHVLQSIPRPWTSAGKRHSAGTRNARPRRRRSDIGRAGPHCWWHLAQVGITLATRSDTVGHAIGCVPSLLTRTSQ
jgi:hypothetical protein